MHFPVGSYMSSRVRERETGSGKSMESIVFIDRTFLSVPDFNTKKLSSLVALLLSARRNCAAENEPVGP